MSSEHAAPIPVRIPVPPDFPVTWASPEDEHMMWTHDRMHAPDPVVPLEEDFWARTYGGFSGAAQLYSMPLQARARTINTYVYSAFTPAAPPEEMEALGRRSQERVREVLGRLETLWKDQWLPEIKSHLAWWHAFDLRAASGPALVVHLRESLARMDRLWALHFEIVLPVYSAISQFDDFYRDLFGSDGAFSSYKLLQGFDNKTLETFREMWLLSRKARNIPAVRQVLEERSAGEVMDALGQTAEGRAFQADVRRYLAEYGQRADKWGLVDACWIEDPSPVFQNMQTYIAQTGRSAMDEQAGLIAERDRAVAESRERLRGYPQAVVDEFEFLLKAAQFANVLTEDHGFWIDFNATFRVRTVFLEFGRRLAEAGAIDGAASVFYLTLDEVLLLESSLATRHLHERVAERRATVERFRKVSPPPALGTDYGPPPDDPLGRSLMKFFGAPPPASDTPGMLRGHAGSPGKVRGRACVISRLEMAGKLKRGDVLVTETTAPPWTPLFATAGAIVTDTGGVLSHCAVVAREYAIPAVVGTGRATATIQDGQLLEVDGDTGVVTIIGD